MSRHPGKPTDEEQDSAAEEFYGDRPQLITARVCGGKQARICRVTGKAHDMSAFVAEKNGGSVACKDCGVTAMSLDLLELP